MQQDIHFQCMIAGHMRISVNIKKDIQLPLIPATARF